MPVAAAAASSAVGVAKKRIYIKSKQQSLEIEALRKLLQIELTTKFPDRDNMKFDQDRELLMMDG